MKVHLIYVKGDSISTPFAVTRELSSRLSKRVALEVYDWASRETIRPDQGDILIGHPFPYPGRIFENSFHQKGWAKRILLCPFTHSMPHYISFIDQYIDECDAYLAISGEYWFKTLSSSLCSHWAPKLIRIDLGINTDHFPFIKGEFNPPGKRKFLYIGRNADYKGIDYLIDLAKKNPDLHIGWIGDTGYFGHELKRHGAVDFSTESGRLLVKDYDFLLTCGRADANPTTILEAASWGLVVVCTPQSGYSDTAWITNIPLDDVIEASKILRGLSVQNEENLINLQHKARADLPIRFSWDKFEEKVWEVISSTNAHTSEGSVSDREKLKNKKLLRRNYKKTLIKGYARHLYERALRAIRRVSLRS